MRPKVSKIVFAVLLVTASSMSAAMTKTTGTLSSSVNPSFYGEEVILTDAVSSSLGAPPNGENVSFMQGKILLGIATLEAGKATFAISTLTTGSKDDIDAVYSGDSNFAGCTSNVVGQLVNKASTTTSLVSSSNPSNLGQSVTFTATVTPQFGSDVTGNVEFYNGSQHLASVAVSGELASFATASLPAGEDSITADYNGNNSWNSSTSNALSQSVVNTAPTKTTTTLSSSPNPSIYGQAVTFSAKVTSSVGAPPNGETVSFMQGKTLLGTGALNGGLATFTISTLTTGSKDEVDAVYGGDSTFAGSTSNDVGQLVNKASTTTSLVSSLNPANVGQSVSFTATVTPQFGSTLTGNVEFYNGTQHLATVALSGEVASFTTASLPAGSDSVTADYNGNDTWNSSASGIVSQSVGTGTTINTTMSFDNVTRYYQLFVPTVLPANPPMLLMLHGTSYGAPPYTPSTTNWGWQSFADQYGFILVQPASTYNPNTNQWNWNAYFMDAAFAPGEAGTCTEPPATGCPDDAGFLRQLISNLTAQYHVNPKSVFVTGFSSGAQMTERVGVEISDLVAAIAPTSGQLVGQQVPPPGLPGNEAAPVAVQEWHGTADHGLPPCNEGTTVYSGVTFTLDTVDDTFNYWVEQNACTALETSTPLCTDGAATPGSTGNDATSCIASNVEVQFIWEQDIGHSWRSQNNATRWLFLSAHSKP